MISGPRNNGVTLLPFSKFSSDQEVLFSGDAEVEVDVIKVVVKEVWETLVEGDGVVESVFEAVAVHEVRIETQTKQISKIMRFFFTFGPSIKNNPIIHNIS